MRRSIVISLLLAGSVAYAETPQPSDLNCQFLDLTDFMAANPEGGAYILRLTVNKLFRAAPLGS